MRYKYVQFFNFRYFHRDPFNTFMTYSGAHMSKLKRMIIKIDAWHQTHTDLS